MARNRNTDRNGNLFKDDTVGKVWEKGRVIDGENKDKVRKDRCGTKIERSLYGKIQKAGWEIDHIKPVVEGGSDELSNLQPLFWETNRDKGDTYPWTCP
jgi:5-methylcytosine-specific restriction endonuclease McrA